MPVRSVLGAIDFSEFSAYGPELTLLHGAEEDVRDLARADVTIGECTDELGKLIQKEEHEDINV